MRFLDRISSGNCVPKSMSRVGCAFPKSAKRKMHPGIDAQNGTHFPFEPQAEAASRNPAPEWDVLSEQALKRKAHPTLSADSGTRFPSAANLENTSHSGRLFRDAVSAEILIRKAATVLGPDSGTQFPLGRSMGRRVSDWQTCGRRRGRVVAQQSYRFTSLSHVGSVVWRIPAVCSFFASTPAERTSLMVKRSRG